MKKQNIIRVISYVFLVVFFVVLLLVKMNGNTVDIPSSIGALIVLLKLGATLFSLYLAWKQFMKYNHNRKTSASQSINSLLLSIMFLIFGIANFSTMMNSLLIYGYVEVVFLEKFWGNLWGMISLFAITILLWYSFRAHIIPLSSNKKKSKTFAVVMLSLLTALTIFIWIGATIFILGDNEAQSSPYAPLVILASLISYLIALIWYYKINRKIGDSLKNSADYERWKMFGYGIEASFVAIVLTILDFLLVTAFNTYYAPFSWIVTLVSYYLLNEGI